MALPNSHYQWILQALWGIRNFISSLGMREIIYAQGRARDTTNTLRIFDGSNGPYLMNKLWYEHYGTPDPGDEWFWGNYVTITVDDEPFVSEHDMHLNTEDVNFVGRDGTLYPFILARKRLVVESTARWNSRGGTVYMRILRFGE